MTHGRIRRFRTLSLLATAGLSCAALGGDSDTRRGRDALDPDYAAEIAAHTTEARYLTEWVDHLPTSRRVASPKQFLGYSIGTPDRLTAPDEIVKYFRELERSSDRVQVFSMGKSHGGREMIVAAIGSKKNLRRLEQIKAANHELADPRNTDAARAEQIAGEIPPTFWITAGLHSPETGPPEMVMELAYRLAVSEQDHIREIRDGVVVLITPVLEMDGRARVVDWNRRHLTGVKDLENAPPRMGPYWGDYTAHDNNRDGLQLSQPLTRNYVETFHEFLPVATLDLHESVPLLYVSTGTGPYNDAIDPITVAEWQLFASNEVATATKLGLQGVWTWGFYTGWYPGYLLWVSTNHHGVGRFYETFGNSHPGTFERDLSRSEFADRRLNSRQWYRPWPPDKKVQWSLRNNTNYMQTGVLASLQFAARHGDQLLSSFWKKHRNAVDRGRTTAPHGFVIPRSQRDDGALDTALALLERHRVELHRATADSELADGVSIAAGDIVVRMDQPYSNFARTLLLPGEFPKTAQHTPYDDVAWSLDYMLGVTVHPTADPGVLELGMEAIDDLPELRGSVPETKGEHWVVDHRGQASLASLLWALPETAKVRATPEAWSGHPAGSLIVSGVDAETMRRAVEPLHLHATGAGDLLPGNTFPVERPRVAVFHTWRYTQDSGWVRFTLEELGIPYTLIDKDDVKAGKLRERFDVVMIPSQGGMTFRDIVHGIDPKWGPLEYTRTDEFPSHGVIDSSPDITGGMGFEGVAEVQAYVEAGGVLLGLGSGGVLAADGGIARKVSTSRPGGSPGSHVTTTITRPEHPLAFGYPEVDWIFRGNHPVYSVREYDRGHVVSQFGTKTFAEAERERDKKADVPTDAPQLAAAPVDGASDAADAAHAKAREPGSKAPKLPPFVRSGLVKKADALQRKPAVLDIPVGAGHVIFYAWNPMHRYQNHHDFAWVTNALLFHEQLPAKVPTREEMYARETPAPPTADTQR